MAKSLDDVLSAFTPEQRAQVDARVQELIEEALTLRDLRQAHHLTQERMAALLSVEQENVSRIEWRADLLLSTLASYVAAIGGKLQLIAAFPNPYGQEIWTHTFTNSYVLTIHCSLACLPPCYRPYSLSI